MNKIYINSINIRLKESSLESAMDMKKCLETDLKSQLSLFQLGNGGENISIKEITMKPIRFNPDISVKNKTSRLVHDMKNEMKKQLKIQRGT